MLKKQKQIFIIAFIISVSFFSCTKDPLDPNGGGGGGGTGSLASFNVIPIPTVDIANQVIPNLASFYVTNKGPYIQVQNTAALRWSVYKYQGGSGSAAWTSFNPSFATSYFRPTSMFYENENVFSIYWCSTDLPDDKYGMYNVNTGTPSFDFLVPSGAFGPSVFSEVIPPTKAANSGRVWAIIGNEIWRESFTVVPKTIDFVIDLPAVTGRIRTDAIMADPDNDSHIWVAAEGRLYQVSEVGNPTAPYGTIVSSWNFGSISATDRIQTILKVNGEIVVQFGNGVFKKNGTSFSRIGTLNTGVGNNICTNGSTIYSSDGTYYDSNSNTWKPFIGSGVGLSGTDLARYNELTAYCSSGAPIGCVYGSGPVYLLVLDKLVQISPVL